MSEARMPDSIRAVLRMYSEQDVPFEDVAAEIRRAPAAEAVAEVRRAAGLGWLTPDERKILMTLGRSRV